MKGAYKLSKTNIVLSIIYIVVVLISVFSSKDLNLYGIGFLLGNIVGAFIFPFAISLLVWLISKKNNKYGNIAFTVIMVLLFLSQLAKCASPNY